MLDLSKVDFEALKTLLVNGKQRAGSSAFSRGVGGKALFCRQ